MSIERKPFQPEVSAEEFCAYRSGHPETYTSSSLVNAVCDAFEKFGYADGIMVAYYLRLNKRKLSIALEVLTGHTLAKFRQKLVDDRIIRCRQEHPGWDANKIADYLGLCNRSTVWRRIKDDHLPVSYTPTSRPFTNEDIVARLKESLRHVKEGDSRALEKFLEEMERNE